MKDETIEIKLETLDKLHAEKYGAEAKVEEKEQEILKLETSQKVLNLAYWMVWVCWLSTSVLLWVSMFNG